MRKTSTIVGRFVMSAPWRQIGWASAFASLGLAMREETPHERRVYKDVKLAPIAKLLEHDVVDHGRITAKTIRRTASDPSTILEIVRKAFEEGSTKHGITWLRDPEMVLSDHPHEYQSVSRLISVDAATAAFIDTGGFNVMRVVHRTLLNNCFELPLTAAKKYEAAAEMSIWSMAGWRDWSKMGIDEAEAERFNAQQAQDCERLDMVACRLSSNLVFPSIHTIGESRDGRYRFHSVNQTTSAEHMLAADALWILALDRHTNQTCFIVCGGGYGFPLVDAVNDEMVTVLWPHHAEKAAIALADEQIRDALLAGSPSAYSDLYKKLPTSDPYNVRDVTKMLDFMDRVASPLLIAIERDAGPKSILGFREGREAEIQAQLKSAKMLLAEKEATLQNITLVPDGDEKKAIKEAKQ